MASLQSATAAPPPQETAPKKRGRPKRVASVLDIVTQKNGASDTWRQIPDEEYDSMLVPLPSVAIPRSISPDPSVFVQLGPLPHAKIEASLCLAALMHRTAQVVQKQIEDGVGAMEDDGSEAESPSPFESPLPIKASHKARRHWRQKKRRRYSQQ